MGKKTNTKPIYKSSSFYFILIYALVTLVTIIQVFMSSMIPLKYTIPAIIVLLLLAAGMYYLQMGKKINKVNKYIGRFLIVILSIAMILGNYYLFVTGSALGKMSGVDTETSSVSVVVMKDSQYKKMKDLEGALFGTVTTGDAEIQKKAIKDIEKEIGKIDKESYTSYIDFGDALYNNDVDAIILNEGARALFEENHPDFDKETRVIKTYDYEKKTKKNTKGVKVTDEAFNVYLTGVDTYGTIATVSRSDVNMIITVHPETKQILLTSIPRDYYVPQPCQRNQEDKLTHSGLWGVDATVETIENYFGIDLNYYMRVNFSSVIDIVDALGGITVNSPNAFSVGNIVNVQVGDNYLNGEQTLAFVRERYSFAGGDRERGRNQMRAIQGILNKATSPAIIYNYASVMDAIGGSFQTNMSTSEINSLINMQLDDMAGWNITQISVNGTGSSNTWSPANGFNSYVMIPNVDTVNSAVNLIEKVQNGEVLTQADVDAHNAIAG